MAYLTEKEKSILFSAITREEKVCKEHGYDDLVQVCQRLLHVFSYNRFEKHIRNKAIDEFTEQLKNKLVLRYGSATPTEQYVSMQVTDWCGEIAEQMKKQ